jgi:glycosyltransferase involved in cell wall biosynthesis
MLSVIIPVFNETRTALKLVEAVNDVPVVKQIIIVDDCSTDGTRELLNERFTGRKNIILINNKKNLGKGAAIRIALDFACEKYTIIQDADLEYSPNDYIKLLSKAEQLNAGAVYGSRFLNTWRSTSLPHFIVNRFLTLVANILFRSNLTDMETCYKMIRTDIFKGLSLQSRRFEIEPEITAKLLLRGYRIIEAPISYRGRSYHQGKKISWKDGVLSLCALFYWWASARLVDSCNIYRV